jgi:hypothetical protein
MTSTTSQPSSGNNAGSSTTGSTPNRPADPLMGSTEETYANSNVYYYAFGGKPKVDWSGLEHKPDRLLSDLCFRSLDPIAGQKSAVVRTKGLSERYEKSNKLTDFQKSVWNHMLKFGLDTIGYLPDPKDNTKVQSVVTHHARFTGDLTKAITTSKMLQQSFDKWDKKHDYEAREFLLESLSKEIRNSFETFHDQHDTFASTWLKLVHHLVTTTAKTYDSMKDKIRSIRPQQYAGQNIEHMATDLIKMSEELDNAGHFDHSLTLNMVDGFLCATSDAKGTFHHELNNLRSQVAKKRQEFLFLSKFDQDVAFANCKLTYKDVCLVAVKEYKDLHSMDMWEPGKLPKDRLTPSANLTTAHILQLIENVASKTSFHDKKSTSKSDPKKRGCFNCGSLDHQVKDCPKPKPTDQQARANRHGNMPKWKLTAPKSGEPMTKQVNGRSFHWCGKCGNWTTTHSTNTHTGTSRSSKSTNPKKKSSHNAETNLTAWDPSAWVVTVSHEDKPVIMPHLISLFWIAHVLLTVIMMTRVFEINWSSLANLTDTMSLSALAPSLHTMTYSLAPLLWFTLGFLACSLTRLLVPFDPISDASVVSRQHRRITAKKSNYCQHRPHSAKSHNLISQYPLRLRNKNAFNSRQTCPTVHERELANHLKSLPCMSCLYNQPPTCCDPITTGNSRKRMDLTFIIRP